MTASTARPVEVRWAAKPRARYYNVVLWHDGRRVLDLWPTATRTTVPLRWIYRGRGHGLVRGNYLWFVYPGIGERGRGRYGELIAQGHFTIAAADRNTTSTGGS